MSNKALCDVTIEFIQEAIKSKNEELPEDATLERFEYKTERDVVVCLFKSNQFQEVMEGGSVPFVHEVNND